MPDESPLRSGRESDAGDGASGSAGEPASLQGRAAFLANWDWQPVVRLNERLCASGRAQHGKNSETHAACEKEWLEGVQIQRTLLETLGWLRSFHRKAPFLFFNGNTFCRNRPHPDRRIFRRIPSRAPARSGVAGRALCCRRAGSTVRYFRNQFIGSQGGVYTRGPRSNIERLHHRHHFMFSRTVV